MKKRLHFIGIGGISMSGLAEILHKNGHIVSGSDDTESEITRHLSKLGINISIPNAAENITDDIETVIYTAAVKPQNPEFSAAKQKGIIMTERAELLGELLKDYDYPICIAGTHGKTTTTSFMAEVVIAAGLNPTISIGGHMGFDGSNYRVGGLEYFILEACEYSNSFHHWHPQVGIILNIDADHLDFFGNMEGVVSAFRKFAENIRPGGVLVVQVGQRLVTAGLQCKIVTFGLTNQARYWPHDVEYDKLGRPSFDVMDGERVLGRISLPMPGEYNMLNAVACFAAAVEMGINNEIITHALSKAKGVKRRFEHKGKLGSIDIIDDYAHHPTEIEACLKAAKKTGRRVVCVFQPHTYSRTKNHLDQFALTLAKADVTILLPIYPAREPFDETISSLMLTNLIGGNAIHLESFDAAQTYLHKSLVPGDLLITMGAGDVYKLGEALLTSKLST